MTAIPHKKLPIIRPFFFFCFPEAPSEVLVTNSADAFSFVCFLVVEEIKSRQAPIFWKKNQAKTEMHLSRMRCLKRLYQTD